MFVSQVRDVMMAPATWKGDTMKPIRTTLAATLALGTAFAAGGALAQGMSVSQIDANGDSMLDATELQAAFGQNAQAALTTYDQNGDGMVALTEATAVSARGAAEDDRMMTQAEADAMAEVGSEVETGNMNASGMANVDGETELDLGVN